MHGGVIGGSPREGPGRSAHAASTLHGASHHVNSGAVLARRRQTSCERIISQGATDTCSPSYAQVTLVIQDTGPQIPSPNKTNTHAFVAGDKPCSQHRHRRSGPTCARPPRPAGASAAARLARPLSRPPWAGLVRLRPRRRPALFRLVPLHRRRVGRLLVPLGLRTLLRLGRRTWRARAARAGAPPQRLPDIEHVAQQRARRRARAGAAARAVGLHGAPGGGRAAPGRRRRRWCGPIGYGQARAQRGRRRTKLLLHARDGVRAGANVLACAMPVGCASAQRCSPWRQTQPCLLAAALQELPPPPPQSRVPGARFD